MPRVFAPVAALLLCIALSPPVMAREGTLPEKLDEIAEQVAADYAGKDLLLVGVLKGAIMVMADFSRALPVPVPIDWMAVSS